MVERKLFKTKLCVLYQKGHCPRHNCSFAHGSAELRHLSSSSYGASMFEGLSAILCGQFSSSIPHMKGFCDHFWDFQDGSVIVDFYVTRFLPCDGKRDYRGGDLRDKLDGRPSPRRRYSPRRDAGGKRSFHGSSPTRSLDQCRKRQQFDGQSNFSGSTRNPDRAEDRVRERSASPNARLVLEKQLREVQSDISMLDHRKSQLRDIVEQKVEEADSLTSRVQELDAELSKEKDECKRTITKIKKFVKAHKRYIRSQDDLKRSQVRLQKLGDQLISGNEEDSGINVVSDGETTACHAVGQQDGVQINNYLNKKILGVKGDTVEEPTQVCLRGGDDYQEESIRLSKLSGGNADPAQSIIIREVVAVDKWNDSNQFMGNESKQKRGKSASHSNHLADKHLKVSVSGLLVPPTSMAGHAVDESVENEEEMVEVVEAVNTASDGGASVHGIRKLPILLPPPPPTFRNSYSQVDVEGLEEDMINVDIV